MELLIKKAQNGDKEAFISIINEHLQMMYKVAKTRLTSEEDIGDAIQETILSAYKSINANMENIDGGVRIAFMYDLTIFDNLDKLKIIIKDINGEDIKINLRKEI